jgi:hypothetical protein
LASQVKFQLTHAIVIEIAVQKIVYIIEARIPFGIIEISAPYIKFTKMALTSMMP